MEQITDINRKEYWDVRYQENSDHWNLKTPNPVFSQLLDKYDAKHNSQLLVAGSGKGYDAMQASKKGFCVTAIDFSDEAISTSTALAEQENVKIDFINMDLFELSNTDLKFDLVYEYTTFCAVDPRRIEELLKNFNAVLNPGGRFISVLFPIDGRIGGPPFSIDYLEFHKLASQFWKLEYFSKDINSVKPRKEKEYLFIYKK
ncbi:MAG: methyltransferase domain-containing protein [Bacteroidetes bacterium]|nr:methyltransferase domain-containing protein [Bacteroidota bacterium]